MLDTILNTASTGEQRQSTVRPDPVYDPAAQTHQQPSLQAAPNPIRSRAHLSKKGKTGNTQAKGPAKNAQSPGPAGNQEPRYPRRQRGPVEEVKSSLRSEEVNKVIEEEKKCDNKRISDPPADPMTLIRIEKNRVDENIKCDVCKEAAYEEGDEIVICDMCLVAVHRSCYGRELQRPLSKDPWFCDRCTKIRNGADPLSIQCFLCKDLTGVMVWARESKVWAHIECVNWTPEIYFTEEDSKHEIGGEVNTSRFHLRCNYCHRSG